MFGIGVGIGHLHGNGATGSRFDVGEEGILLLGIGRNVGHQLHLALPLAAANALGYGEGEFAALVLGLRIQTAAPVGRAEPGLLDGKTAQEVLAVGVTRSGLLGLFLGQDGAVVDGVVLNDDMGNGYLGAGIAAAKVEDHLHAGGRIDTLDVAQVVNEVVAGRDFGIVGKEEVLVAVGGSELEGGVLDGFAGR